MGGYVSQENYGLRGDFEATRTQVGHIERKSNMSAGRKQRGEEERKTRIAV